MVSQSALKSAIYKKTARCTTAFFFFFGQNIKLIAEDLKRETERNKSLKDSY